MCLILGQLYFVICVVLQLVDFSSHEESLDILSSINGSFPFRAEAEKYLSHVSGFWSFNDTADLSKYELFDHHKFIQSTLNKVEDDRGPKKPTLRPINKTSHLVQTSAAVTQSKTSPTFESTMVTNVSALLGSTAFLQCYIKSLREWPVSWVRRRDWHILTSGVQTYTNDDRFSVVHAEGADNWELQIKYVQKRDNGTYDCQMATNSGVISHSVNLDVVEPLAKISGYRELHVGEGSTINLNCTIANSLSADLLISWKHNDKMLSNNERTRVSVCNEHDSKTCSGLSVADVSHLDTGNYSCHAFNTKPDTVYVYVSKEGDNTAAIQRQATSMTSPDGQLSRIMILAFLISSYVSR